MSRNNLPEGVVDIRGKQYHTVAKRVNDFREKHPEHGLVTDVVENAELIVMRAAVIAPGGFTLATGYAEEKRGQGQINRTSALENCETSAIGRALAAFGFGGTEYASANEVQNAIHQQSEQEAARGQSQGDDQGAASPTASYEFPDGPASGITQLRKMTGDIWREAAGCGDYGEIVGIIEDENNKAVFKQCDALTNPAHRRDIWDGNGGDNPGLYLFLKQRKQELAAKEAA